jgi:hypothetical protein
MKHVGGYMYKSLTTFWLEEFKKRDHMRDPVIDGKNTKICFKKIGSESRGHVAKLSGK